MLASASTVVHTLLHLKDHWLTASHSIGRTGKGKLGGVLRGILRSHITPVIAWKHLGLVKIPGLAALKKDQPRR